MGPLHKRQKNIILCDSKRSSFITVVFEPQFDTSTLIIPFANRGSNLIYYAYNW